MNTLSCFASPVLSLTHIGNVTPEQTCAIFTGGNCAHSMHVRPCGIDTGTQVWVSDARVSHAVELPGSFFGYAINKDKRPRREMRKGGTPNAQFLPLICTDNTDRKKQILPLMNEDHRGLPADSGTKGRPGGEKLRGFDKSVERKIGRTSPVRVHCGESFGERILPAEIEAGLDDLPRNQQVL
jgi:hypothetical protein